jgi:hypothetical protein
VVHAHAVFAQFLPGLRKEALRGIFPVLVSVFDWEKVEG